MATELIEHPVETPRAEVSREGTERGVRRTISVLSLLPIAIAALLASVFWHQRTDVSFQDFTYPWTSHWITSSYRSETVCFRKTITVDGPIRSAYIVLAADNFYQLRVNGIVPVKRFLDEAQPKEPALLARQTVYNETGYGRRDTLGNIYDIATLLVPGRNTISVVLQSDEAQQRLLLQGAYIDSTSHTIESDASWRCSPTEQVHNGVPWYLPQFPDSDWPQARTLNQDTDIPVDGDASLLETPVQGNYISAPHDGQAVTTRFRRIVNCPGTVTQGWVRVNWWRPYDLSINGVVVGSSSEVDRYNLNPLLRRQEWDVLRRVEDNQGAAYPSGASTDNSDVYLARDIMHRGDNEIDITLHNENTLGETPIQAVNLNAHFLYDTGASQLLVTDDRWQVYDPATRRWLPATKAYAPSALASTKARPIIRNLITPGLWAYGRIARNAVILCIVFAIAGLLVERLSPQKISEPAHAGGAGRATGPKFGATFIAPAIILIAALYTQWIFAESLQSQFLLRPPFATAVLLAAGTAWLISAALSMLTDRRAASVSTRAADPEWADIRRSVLHFADRYGFAIALSVIVLMTALYCFAQLGSSDFLPDEYVSMLAARGILRHGIPVYENTHIIYTRSALYHYLLALFMVIGGSTTSAYATRSLAGCWQIATVILVYFFGRSVKSRWMGLIAAALVGLSPFMIFYAREARFYTQITFFSTLCFYYLWQSVRDPKNWRNRVGMGLAFIGAYLSQQLIITVLPAIAAVVFLSGQLRDYLRGSGLAILLAVFAVIGLDYFAYVKYCETPLPFVDSDSMMLFAFHVDWLDALASMLLVSNERSELAVGGLYLLGLGYILIRSLSHLATDASSDDASQTNPWRWWNFLYLVSALTIITTALFTPRPTPRYVINALPLVALAAAGVAEELIRRMDHWAAAAMSRSSRIWIGGLATLAITLLCVLAFRPVRVWNNTQRKDDMSTTGPTLYVKNHMRPGDKLLFCSPELAMMEIGHCDYFWRITTDSIYSFKAPDGVLRERNSGAVAINSIDKLRAVMTQNPRVWVVVPDWQTNPQPNDSEYFRMSGFVQTNCQLVNQGLDDNVYLWDRSSNHYENINRASGEDSLNFSLK